MPYRAAVYNVMIASPSDVSEERQVIREILVRWNAIHAEDRNLVLLPIGWETHSTPETGGHPQEILNKQILKRSDLLVGLFWTRMGTPTDNYLSGSAEEIDRHVAAGKPAMLYFSDQLTRPSNFDSEQYARLQQFKDQWKSHALIGKWEDASDFREKFYDHLQRMLNEHLYFENDALQEIQPAPSNPRPSISEEAKQLLIAAGESDRIIYCRRVLGKETMVSVRGQEFSDGSSPQTAALYEGAIEELEQERLVEDKAGKQELYFVTRRGFQMIDELAVTEGQPQTADLPVLGSRRREGAKCDEMRGRFATLLGEEGYDRLREAVFAFGTGAPQYLRTMKDAEDQKVIYDAGPVFGDPVVIVSEQMSLDDLRDWHQELIRGL